MVQIYGSVRPASAYRPLTGIATVIYGSPIKKALVDVVVLGFQTIATLEVDMVEIAAGIYEGVFDSQSVIQDYLAPHVAAQTTSFATVGSAYSVVNYDLFSGVRYDVRYLEQLPNGQLNDIGIIDSSSQYSALSSTMQHLERFNLRPFLGKVIGSPRGLVLSNMPSIIEIDESESYTLSILSDPVRLFNTNRCRIRTFDKAGTLLDTAIIEGDTLISGHSTCVIWSVGVGVANLVSTTFDQGSLNLNSPNLSYYLVDFGRRNIANWFYQFEPVRFDMTPNCTDKKVRFTWLNDKAGTDSITMYYKEQQTNTKKTLVQAPLKWAEPIPYHSVLQKGLYPVNTEASTTYNLKHTIKSKAEGLGLRGLALSPEIYAEIDGAEMQPVIVVTSATLVDESGELGIFEIEIQPANSIITMRN